MMPAFPPGTIILGVWPGRLRAGDIVVVRHGRLDKIKRIKDIQPDRIFLEGDNGGGSTDSRHFGWLEQRAVIAKVVWAAKSSA